MVVVWSATVLKGGSYILDGRVLRALVENPCCEIVRPPSLEVISTANTYSTKSSKSAHTVSYHSQLSLQSVQQYAYLVQTNTIKRRQCGATIGPRIRHILHLQLHHSPEGNQPNTASESHRHSTGLESYIGYSFFGGDNPAHMCLHVESHQQVHKYIHIPATDKPHSLPTHAQRREQRKPQRVTRGPEGVLEIVGARYSSRWGERIFLLACGVDACRA